MSFPGVTPRLTAVMCLLLAITLLVLVGLFAPTKPPRDTAPTPTLVPAAIPATPLALLLAGSPRPHPAPVTADYRVTPAPAEQRGSK